jgi:NAD(P)-dependent dehydrogenase (short-subunit alcohol dehydrogenase family)
MSRIIITGSSDGLGLMAAQLLVEQGRCAAKAVLPGRNSVQDTELLAKPPERTHSGT